MHTHAHNTPHTHLEQKLPEVINCGKEPSGLVIDSLLVTGSEMFCEDSSHPLADDEAHVLLCAHTLLHLVLHFLHTLLQFLFLLTTHSHLIQV